MNLSNTPTQSGGGVKFKAHNRRITLNNNSIGNILFILFYLGKQTFKCKASPMGLKLVKCTDPECDEELAEISSNE